MNAATVYDYAKFAWRVYTMAKGRDYKEALEALTFYIQTPLYSRAEHVVGGDVDRGVKADVGGLKGANVIGEPSATAAMHAYTVLHGYLAGLSKDGHIGRVTPEFTSAVALTMMLLRKFVERNFDQPTLDASAEESGARAEGATFRSRKGYVG